jgi:phenylalanyl-tRNA synthetase beta chain
MVGYTELLTFALVSWEENYDLLLKPRDQLAVSVEKPATVEFQIVRTSLLPSMLKVLDHSKSRPLPLQVHG